MAIPINIKDLLNKQKIESNRIEFKKGWNPTSIYHSICAFANDFEDLGGGYILVGVTAEEKSGLAIRPIEGLLLEEIDKILKEMVGYNNKISPYYMPRTSVEEVDGKHLLVIWCPSGINRPYSVPENVMSKTSKENFYIRSGTSSIVAKGELQKNGSPRASIETNEERSFINIFIPIHEGCGDTVILNVPQDVPQDVPHDEDLDRWIEEQILKNPNITTQELADLSQRSSKTIKRHILKLPHIQYKGSGSSGHWEIER